jgi:hypothetical protein
MAEADRIREMEEKVYNAVRRSAVVIVSGQISQTLGSLVSRTQLIVLLIAAQCVFTQLRSMPGFGASWDALRSITQNLLIQTSVAYVTVPWSRDLALLNLLAVLAIVECVPKASGWVGQDISSFQTGITYVFSDRISSTLKSLKIPLIGGAALSACLSPKSWGVFGETLALSGVTLLSETVFSMVNGGFALSLIWPVVLLLFLKELTKRQAYFQSYFDFGVYKASDLLYASLRKTHGLSSWTVGIFFSFVLVALKNDGLWDALSALVIVFALSDWLLNEVLGGISKTDPVLAGLILVTVMFFVGCVLNRGKK